MVPLRNVTKNSSLAEIIIAEHGNLRDTDASLITSILHGQTSYKVLLLLDGYDEYTPGMCTAIDKAIVNGTGNCYTILTSRPEHDRKDKKTDFVPRDIRNKMDGEVLIEGFSDENIQKCSTKYLDSEAKSTKMLAMAKESNIYNLLSVPIILLMVCVLYDENERLPKSRTDIFHLIYQRTIDRSTLKAFNCEANKLEDLAKMLKVLGEFAWDALHNDVRQLLLKKVSKSKSLLKIVLF